MTHHTLFGNEVQPRDTLLVGQSAESISSRMGGCPWATTLTAWSGHYEWHVLIQLPCKRWGCQHCGRVKAARLARATEKAEPNRLITLTSNPNRWSTPRECFDGVRRRLPDFNKRIRKEVGSFEYVRVLETHKNGYPHWHLVARSPYIPQQLIKTIWGELSGATIVDVRAVRQKKGMARYVMKYLSKCHYIPWTSRRVSWSKQFFPRPEAPEKVDWKLESKQHHRSCPAKVAIDEWYGWRLDRIGSYAWLPRVPGSGPPGHNE